MQKSAFAPLRAALAATVTSAALLFSVTPTRAVELAAVPSATSFFMLNRENQLVPATGVVDASPGAPITLTGITAGDTLVAIDVRPQTGQLYGLGVNTTTNAFQLYLLSPITARATPIGTPGILESAPATTIALNADSFGIDFNPTVDRLRVVASNGLNFRINPNTGAAAAGTTPDGGINGATTTLGGTAYTNSVPNVTVTTQYGIDAATDTLYIQTPPNTGTQTAGQRLTLAGAPADVTAVGGFDIPADVLVTTANTAATGLAYATLTIRGASGIYSIELSNGTLTLVRALGAQTDRGLAIWAPTPAGIALNADGTSLARFLLATPATSSTVAVAGVLTGETLVGIDFRPATGQLYGLGVNATTNTATLYLIDPQGTTGTTTVTTVGTPGGIAFVDGAGLPVDLPDPSVGYGVDFNPLADRLRVVTGTGLNFRVIPADGAPVDGNLATTPPPAGVNPDGAQSGLPTGSTGVSATAYTNTFAAPTATTQYTIDTASDQLFIQNPPNNGPQTMAKRLTLNGAAVDLTAINGFDIPPGASVATANAPATGNGYFSATVGGVTGLYRVDLATGGLTALGGLSTGLTGSSGLVIWNETANLVTSTSATISEAAGPTQITITSTGGVPQVVSYRIIGGTATAGRDFTTVSGTLLLGGTNATQTITLPITDDTFGERNETLLVEVSAGGVAQTITIVLTSNDRFAIYLPVLKN